MAQNSFALMTNLGRAKEAAALANGTAIVITHIAIGDGTTIPSGGETALYNEIARKAISGHGTVVGASNVAYFDIFLAASEGPYTIREAGLYDNAGDLIAIARYDPPINKPVPASGQTVEGTVRLEVAFSNVANITIVVDPAFTIPLQRLSRLPWISVLSMSITAPPATPALGDAYVVPAGATGAWAGQSGKVAEYTTAGWGIITPPDGHGISLPDGRVFEKIAGTYIEKLALDAQSGKWNYATSGGTAAALTAALSPAPVSLSDGLPVLLRLAVKPNAGATFNLNGLGARPLKGPDGEAIRVGDTALNATVLLVYSANLTCWVVLTPPQMPTQVTGFKANNLGVMAIPANVNTDVKFSNTIFDTLSGYSISSGVYTVKKAGVYQFNANFWMPDVDAISKLFISRNGLLVAETSANTRGRVLAVSTLETCAINDQIKVVVRQESAGTVSTSAGGGFGFSGSLIGGI
ncbi:phage tail protein [Brucella sp. H1_1004]|uniref:phage tail-collar fiber domain-containing protein n=1 Tax=Brucella sp. H1_1004 TaxID=3110109 RepID=UPI0039B53D38